jgi:hypothetical protein
VSQSSILHTATSLGAGRFGVRIQTVSGVHPASYLTGTGVLSGGGGRGKTAVKLSTHFPLVPKSRMSWAIPLHAFMMKARDTLLLEIKRARVCDVNDVATMDNDRPLPKITRSALYIITPYCSSIPQLLKSLFIIASQSPLVTCMDAERCTYTSTPYNTPTSPRRPDVRVAS